MNIKNIEHCQHCVSYSPKTYRKLESNGTLKLFIGCANQNKCVSISKQFDNTLMKDENIMDLKGRAEYIMNSNMTMRDLLSYVKRTYKSEKGYIVAHDSSAAVFSSKKLSSCDFTIRKKYYSYNDAGNDAYYTEKPKASVLKKQIKNIYVKTEGVFVMYIVDI